MPVRNFLSSEPLLFIKFIIINSSGRISCVQLQWSACSTSNTAAGEQTIRFQLQIQKASPGTFTHSQHKQLQYRGVKIFIATWRDWNVLIVINIFSDSLHVWNILSWSNLTHSSSFDVVSNTDHSNIDWLGCKMIFIEMHFFYRQSHTNKQNRSKME